MNEIWQEATEYFDRLWSNAKEKWLRGDVPAADMRNGKSIPIHYCLSTVARFAEQQTRPDERIDSILERIKSVADNQFFYPEGSIHITLLGCTQRALTKSFFSQETRKRILGICRSVVEGKGPVKMRLKGIGIIGNQAFVQVYPYNNTWSKFRYEIATALQNIGENPITYPDMSPIHMNIMRVTNNNHENLLEILLTVESLRNEDIGEFEVSVIDYLITDFVLSPGEAECIDKILL